MTTLENILHVEDDESIVAISRLALETVGGMTVKSCTRGQQAIEAAPGFQPDLILLDVMMPDMDGPTTLTELAKVIDLASRPVVFMTARTCRVSIRPIWTWAPPMSSSNPSIP